MALVKDKRGNWCNTEYKFAIEYCPYSPTRDDGFRCWFRRGRYKTQRAMLQALKQLKDSEANCKNRSRSSHDGGKTWHETHWLFRPIHLNYDLPSDGI
jgi:hypothetical protein